jgi:hypothetical protein
VKAKSQISNERRIGGRTFSKPEECKTFASEEISEHFDLLYLDLLL